MEFKYGWLTDLETGTQVRPADENEWRISKKLALVGPPNLGVFAYGDQKVFVEGGEELGDANYANTYRALR